MELAIQTAGAYEEVAAVAQWAETRGLAAVALPDHYLYGPPDETPAPAAPDALIQLAGLARDTTTIGLVSLVSPVTFRHPAVHAKSAISIDRMSGGRFTFGLGTGWMDAEHEVFDIPYPPMSRRFELLEDQLGYVRAARDNASFHGTHYSLADFDIQPRPVGPLDLLVGGAGARKTPRLAGLYADEFNAYARPIGALRDRIRTARSHLAEVGRPPDGLVISTACVPVIGANQAAYNAAKASAADLFKTPVDDMDQRLAESGTLHGTPSQFAETLAAWAELDVERYYVQRPGRTLQARAHLFDLMEAVLP